MLCTKISNTDINNYWVTNSANTSEYIVSQSAGRSSTIEHFVYNPQDSIYRFEDGTWVLQGGQKYYINPTGSDPDLLQSHSQINNDLFKAKFPIPTGISTIISDYGLDPDYSYFICEDTGESTESDSGDLQIVDKKLCITIYKRSSSSSGTVSYEMHWGRWYERYNVSTSSVEFTAVYMTKNAFASGTSCDYNS
jgi:hypothetical protein